MKKFIITEEEKSRILNLYEKIGDKLSAQALGSPKAQLTKKQAQVLNNYYKINLKSATTGDWQDKEFNETLKKFMEEKGIPVHICKTGDGYCGDDSDGEVTTKEVEKLKNALFGGNENEKPLATSKTNTNHDKSYDYKVENGKYYFKGKEGTPTATKYPNWVEATGKGLEVIKKTVKF
jgi:hypothetical protein